MIKLKDLIKENDCDCDCGGDSCSTKESITENKNPNHVPKINPADKPTGDPKPAAKVHKMVKHIYKLANINKFDCLNSKK